MSEKKTVFKYFTIVNYEKEEEYLREMNKSGWKFTKVTCLGIYHFEKCEPEDVIYQLDYNKDGLEHKDEYIQMFRDCGWEYLQDFVGYSYFRKPAAEADGNEKIFCDDNSRAEFYARVFKGRMIPMIIMFFALIIGFVLLLTEHMTVLSIIYAVLLVFYIYLFLIFALKYSKYRKSNK